MTRSSGGFVAALFVLASCAPSPDPPKGAPAERAAALHARAEQRLARQTRAELVAARRDFEQAATLWLEAGNTVRAGDAYGSAGEAADALGDQRDALATSARALELFRAAGDRAKEQDALVWVAIAQGNLGDFDASLAAYRASLAIAESRDDERGIAEAYRGFGFAYGRGDRWIESIEANNKALGMAMAMGDRANEAITRNNLGDAYAALGEADRAEEEHRRALRLRLRIGNPLQTGWSFLNLGNVEGDIRRNPDEAIAFYRRALEVWRPIGNNTGIPFALSRLGANELERGRVREAIAALEEAVGIWDANGVESGLNRALVDLGHAYVEAGREDDAARTFERAVELNEKLATSSNLARALAARAGLRRRGGDDLAAQRDLERAVAAIEATRAGIPLAELKLTYMTMIRDTYLQLADVHAAAGRAAEALEVTEHGRARVLLDRLTLGASSPGPAPSVHVATARAIQEALAPEDVLVELQLGERRSWAWIVDRERVRAVELAPEKVIAAIAARLSTSMTARSHPPTGRDPVEWARAQDLVTRGAVDELAAMLVRPLGTLSARRVVLVLDGALHVTPMRLVLDAAGYSELGLERVPSASVLVRLPSAMRNSGPPRVVVFADPVFSESDRRVRGDAGGDDDLLLASVDRDFDDGARVARAARDLGMGELARLAETRSEAQSIARLAPERVTVLTDFAASEAALADPAVATADVLHFATHGLLGDGPERTGLVLSLVREDGAPRPGFLTVSDVERLDIGARLVVLSACQSGLGEQHRGEGIVGLVHAFLESGAAQVVATLWDVDDAAMALLMSYFYEALLTKGRSPADALRDAQRALARDPRYSAPYFWAGVTLYGRG